MRTLQELKELLNPDGSKNGHWTHVPVLKKSIVNLKRGDVVEEYIELHELYFDDNGDFLGIINTPSSVLGNDIEDLKLGLSLMLKSCGNPVITEEEKDLIRNADE